ncbi:MAG: leucine-rich repeat protein [Ruminococcus sp.]|nr:leucine-rich repeat protein [Ruminococcus sp.]
MLKKKITAALLACTAVMSMAVPSASAVSFDAELQAAELQAVEDSSAKTLFSDEIVDASGFIYRTDAEEKCSYICGYTNTNATSVTIPSSIGGYPVTHIYDYAFEDFTKLTTVVMPDTVIDIGICSFSDCYSLTNITFSKNLQHLSVYAFENCVSLKKVNLPDTVESIYSGSFWGCTGMTEFHIPTSCDFIGSETMFIGCPNLRKITFGSSTELSSTKNSDPFTTNVLYIPPSVTEITVTGGKLSYKNGSYSEFSISGFTGTTAQSFAASQGITFRPVTPNSLGDIDNDGNVNALDASIILTAYAASAVNTYPDLSVIQLAGCDVDGDGAANSLDASYVLSYYAYTATGGKDSFENYLK